MKLLCYSDECFDTTIVQVGNQFRTIPNPKLFHLLHAGGNVVEHLHLPLMVFESDSANNKNIKVQTVRQFKEKNGS